MRNFCKTLFLSGFFLLIFGLIILGWHWQSALAQTKLTYPEIITALNSKLPNSLFKNKTQLLNWLITQIKQRKIDKALNESREEDLRQAGATDELIEAIRQNSPPLPTPKPTPGATPTPAPISTPTPLLTPVPTPKPDLSIYIKQGNELRDKGEYELAIKEYNKAIELDSQNADAFFNRGIAFHYFGDSDLAFKDYRTAVKLKSELGSEDRMKCLLHSEDNDKPDTGIEVCTKVIGLLPNFGLAYYQRGIAHLDGYGLNTVEGIADFNKAIEIQPKFPLAYANRGAAQTAKKNYAAALTDFNKAIELNPKVAITYRNRGRLYEKEDEFEKSIEDINKYLELSPRALAKCRSLCYPINYRTFFYGSREEKVKYLERLKVILNAFNKAIRERPEYVNNYYGREGVIWGFYDYDDNLYKSLTKINRDELRKSSKPQTAQEFYVRAELTWGEELVGDNTLSDVDTSINLDKEFASAYLLRGFLKRENYEIGLKDMEKAVSLYPKFTDDYFYFEFYRREAAKLYEQKQYEKALIITTKLVETASSRFLKDTLGERAKIYEKLGRKDLAQADRARAKQLQ